MKSLIRYKTKPEFADENQRLVEKVYEELGARDPGGVHYATFRLADGVTFLHVFTTDSADRSKTLGSIAAFAEFQRDRAQRCAAGPVPQGLPLFGSHTVLGERRFCPAPR